MESGLIGGLHLIHANFSTNADDFSNYDVVYSYSPTVSDQFAASLRSSPRVPLLLGPCIDQNYFPVELLRERERVWYLGASYWAAIRHVDVLRSKLPKMQYSRHAAGIDTHYFKPAPGVGPRQVTLYIKSCSWTPRQEEALLKALREIWPEIATLHRVGYGDYTEQEFLAQLQRSAFAVVCGRDETQGVAIMEMMSVGLPLMVFRGNGNHSPYLCDQCGTFYESEEAFASKIRDFVMMVKNRAFDPRDYVVKGHSLEASARRLLQLACRISGK